MGVVPCPTDFTDAHRFHRCTQIFLRSPDVSSHADFADFADLADFYLFTFLNFHTDLAFPSAADFQFTDLTDFLLFHFFTFLPLKAV